MYVYLESRGYIKLNLKYNDTYQGSSLMTSMLVPKIYGYVLEE